MHVLSSNPLWESFGLRALAYVTYGGADLGECFSTMERIGNGPVEDWYREWTRTGERVYAIARTCESGGHWVSAREAYLRASTYFHVAYLPLFGAPVDPWLVDAYMQEADASAAPRFSATFPSSRWRCRTKKLRCRHTSCGPNTVPCRLPRCFT